MSKHLTPSAFFLSPRAAKSARIEEEEAPELVEPEVTDVCDCDEGCEDEGYVAESAQYDEDCAENPAGYEEEYTEVALAPNQMLLTLSYTLLNQVRQTARAEGVAPEDFILELVAEGITRRAFEDAQRPQPSHLMTRTGYVPPEADGYRGNAGNQFFGGNGQNGGNFRGNGNGQRRFNGNGNGKFNGNGNGGNGGSGGNGNRFNRNNNGNQKNRFDQRNRNKNGNG